MNSTNIFNQTRRLSEACCSLDNSIDCITRAIGQETKSTTNQESQKPIHRPVTINLVFCTGCVYRKGSGGRHKAIKWASWGTIVGFELATFRMNAAMATAGQCQQLLGYHRTALGGLIFKDILARRNVDFFGHRFLVWFLLRSLYC